MERMSLGIRFSNWYRVIETLPLETGGQVHTHTQAHHDRRQRHSGEDKTLPSHPQCLRCHHRPTPALLLSTMATIDDNDAFRPKNVPWNWPRSSIGTSAKAKGRRRSAGAAASASATTTTPPALQSDDRTILDHAAWARALLSPRRRRRQGGQGQRRQQRDPRRPPERRRTRCWKRASRNDCQSAGLRQAGVLAPVGRGEVTEQRDGHG